VKISFIGLGNMGVPMARNLLKRGHALKVYDVAAERVKQLAAEGCVAGTSAIDCVKGAETVITMLPSSPHVRAVYGGDYGVLAGSVPGMLLVDCSTIDPITAREVEMDARAKGCAMVDAPVSGSVITLQQGKLSVMVGGRPDTFERLKPLLLDIGPKVTLVGDNGLALVMKIATNLSLAVQMLAFSEGVLLAEKSGIARETAVDVMTHSVIGSPMVQYRGPFVLKMPDQAWFDVNMMQKDMLLALELGRQVDVPLPATAATNEMLTAARGMGLAKKDFAILFEVLARMSGVNQ